MMGGEAEQAQSHQRQMSAKRRSSEETVRNMNHLMERMHQMIEQVEGIMAKELAVTPDRQQQMAQVMEHMSQELQQMARYMKQETLSENRLREMEQHMDKTHAMIRALE